MTNHFKMEVAVFVNIIDSRGPRNIIQASNGTETGPPAVTFEVPHVSLQGIRIGKRYKLTVEEWPES